ncbi:MAG: adenylate kinase [Nanoarchaeota archaeon]|nr:adenylate kinase [Nanoarchaeota archaeon]
MNIIFMGQQGAGKGTVAAIAKHDFKVPHISTGDIFREAIKNQTELGKLASSYINKGKLVPDDVTLKIVEERLSKEDCKKGFILDGFPRTLNQAKLLDKAVKIERVVLLDIKDDLTVYRLSARRVCRKCAATYNLNPDGFPRPKKEGICDKCGSEIYQREDDKEEAIRERLRIYHTETEPIVEFYEKKGVLRKVDSSKHIDIIMKDTMDALK